MGLISVIGLAEIGGVRLRPVLNGGVRCGRDKRAGRPRFFSSCGDFPSKLQVTLARIAQFCLPVGAQMRVDLKQVAVVNHSAQVVAQFDHGQRLYRYPVIGHRPCRPSWRPDGK